MEYYEFEVLVVVFVNVFRFFYFEILIFRFINMFEGFFCSFINFKIRKFDYIRYFD